MPLRSMYLDEGGDWVPPPNTPPPSGNGGGAPPAGGGGAPAPVEFNTGGGGGGGGSPAVPLQLPQYPGVRIPGAPAFNPTKFVAPTQQDAQNEPGYQFRLQSGTQALDRSAAARGSLRTGGTLNDIMEFGQNFGAQEYQRVFDRAMGAHQLRYQGEYDAWKPQFARWQEQADADKQGQLARYNADLNHYLDMTRPQGGGGGGGGYSFEDWGALDPEPQFITGGPSGYQEASAPQPRGGYRAAREGYPWPDENYY